jgi:colanic acid/amylovoran biosynthesis glycosyltransferase
VSSAPRIAYVVSRYPAPSHAFIAREVQALRALGAPVETFSIRRATPAEVLSSADALASRTTYAIVPPSIASLSAAHARAFATRPLRYLATLLLALRLSAPGLRNRLWHVFYFAEAIVLWRECVRRRIRRIHAHFANVGADVALLASHFGTSGRREDGRPLTWSFTMHGPAEFSDVERHGLAEKVRRATRVICISDFCRSQLMGLVDEEEWSKLTVVHCGVDPVDFPLRRRPAVRQPPVRVLSVGRLVPVKGHAVLLAALAELLGRDVTVQATIVGDGPLRSALESSAERLGVDSHVTFAGAIGQDRIRSYYAEADIFCLPSFAEGLPVVLMEAMATGVPVVASRIMGVPELVEDGVSGVLVRPGRVDELAAALAGLSAAPDVRASMGRSGRARVVEEFDLGRSAAMLMEELQRDVSPAAQ